jgi:hypothetical protein
VFKRLFLDHPTALGEGYWQHQRQALRFGATLLAAGCACLVHALIPAFCVRSGSTAVANLHERMRSRAREAARDPLPETAVSAVTAPGARPRP